MIAKMLEGPAAWAQSSYSRSPLTFTNCDFTADESRLTSVANLRFVSTVRFVGCLFPAFTFDGATFEDAATFHDCTFQDDTSFQSVTFNAGVRFSGDTTFCKGIEFKSCNVAKEFEAEGLIVKGQATFLNVNSPGVAWMMTGARFGNYCRFSGEFRALQLNSAKFHRSLAISGVIDGAIFMDDAKVRRTLDVSALDVVSFYLMKAWIGSMAAADLRVRDLFDATGSKFLRDVDFRTSRDVPFSRVSFLGARILRRIDFSNRAFTSTADFRGCYFAVAPAFHNCRLHQDTDFRRTTFADTTSDEAERRYRTLKLAMNAQQDHRAELDFFALELQSRASREHRLALRLMYWLYMRASDFGRSVRLPAAWLVGLVAISFLIYGAIFDGPSTVACWRSNTCEVTLDATRMSALLSLALYQSLPFIALLKESAASATDVLLATERPVPLLAQLWAILQGLCSIGLFFLLALGLRNLFRLK